MILTLASPGIQTRIDYAVFYPVGHQGTEMGICGLKRKQGKQRSGKFKFYYKSLHFLHIIPLPSKHEKFPE